MAVWGLINPVRNLRELASARRGFQSDIAFRRTQDGPALCESLLRCYAGGKPYLYDPFNATRLVQFGKLDETSIVEGILQCRYSVIQLDSALGADEVQKERFTPRMVDAIGRQYAPALCNAASVMYVPRTASNPP